MKKEVVYLTTWDNEIIEIETDIEIWLNTKIATKNKGEDGIYLKTHKRFLKFSNIKDEKGKTKYLALEEPKQTERTPEQLKQDRIMLEKIHKQFLEENKDFRLKKFIEKRKEILEQLAKEEKAFGLETTNSKVELYLKSQVKKD